MYGLGAVRFWWVADNLRGASSREAYKVGDNLTERTLVRRVALGEPAVKVWRKTSDWLFGGVDTRWAPGVKKSVEAFKPI